MIDRRLRVTVLLAEAAALGLQLGPLEDFVGDENDRLAIEKATTSSTDTVCGFFLDRQRRLWYEPARGGEHRPGRGDGTAPGGRRHREAGRHRLQPHAMQHPPVPVGPGPRGVDLSTVVFDQTTADELQATRPELPQLVDESFTEPAVDAAHGEVWLGSEATPSPLDTASNSDTARVPSRPETPRDPVGGNDGSSLWALLAIVVAIVTASLLGRRAAASRRARPGPGPLT